MHWKVIALMAGVSLAFYGTAAAVTLSLGEITVTGTREESPRAEIPATVGSLAAERIAGTRPGHPAEIMGQIPGVHINITGGEGHTAAIRQPLTTNPVYLYLEDSIPVRSTGFFNHNALYEVNVPQAGGIEVHKGPGTALYGSDAIGGVINILTRPPPAAPEITTSLEGGGHGWRRVLVSGGQGWEDDGLRLDLNLTHTDGWRQATEYDRQSGTLRWDRFLDSGASLKTVLALSNIDQQTAGSSRLFRSDYLNNPTINYTPISFREVQALRFSTVYEKEGGDTLVSVTPYYRNDVMTLLPNWSLSYDATVLENWNQSFGALLKYRRDFVPGRTRLIVGADLDYSPGGRFEQAINTVKKGNIYSSYTINQTVYDYDVTFMAAAPYLHLETSPGERLRFTGGLRLDLAFFDYENKLSVLQTGNRRRPASATVDYSHLSPKLGATYAFSERLNGFVSYRHAFRVPSESQLFRQGQAVSTVDLRPVKAESYELGLRGKRGDWLRYELSGYYMPVKDDILTFQDTVAGTRETSNAGKTLHRGIELGLGFAPGKQISLDLAFSYAKHTYEEWSPKTGVDYANNEISTAPRLISSTRLAWRPEWMAGGCLELEWERLGSYMMDDENTHKYEGYDLFNLRANRPLGRGFELYGRLMNLTDERYATTSSYTVSKGEEFAPGLPRTLYIGLNYAFK